MLIRSVVGLLIQIQALAYGPPFQSSAADPAQHLESDCADQAAGEIVVCAPRTDQQAYRYKMPAPVSDNRNIFRDGIKGSGNTTAKGGSFTNEHGTTAAGVKFSVPF